MEFDGTALVIEIGALKFHGIPWNSTELLVSSKLAHSSSTEFHGIPLNCSCHRNWQTPSSVEFRGIARVIEIGALQIPWNSMEFYGTASVIEIGPFQFPWNFIELFVSSKLAYSQFHGILCNLFILFISRKPFVLWKLSLIRVELYRILSFPILMTIVFNFAGWINFRKLISTLLLFVWLSHQLMCYHQYLHYTTLSSGITHYVSKYHSTSLSNDHWNVFW